jgi:hypothetical protein
MTSRSRYVNVRELCNAIQFADVTAPSYIRKLHAAQHRLPSDHTSVGGMQRHLLGLYRKIHVL